MNLLKKQRLFISTQIMLLFSILFLTGNLFADDTGNQKVEDSIARGLEYLLTQQKDTGAIFNSSYSTTMTALSLMAMGATGHLPSEKDKYGLAMRKGIDYILDEDRIDDRGYFGVADKARMYGHGIVCLALAEMLGMGVDDEQDELIRKRLISGIDVIIKAQIMPEKLNPKNKSYGGWRYYPHSTDSDLSVTIWELLALRSTKNDGLEVPKDAIDRAVHFLKKCYYSKRNEDGTPQNLKSGCGYTPGSSPTYPSASAGLLALQVCGEYDSPEAKGSADWLLEYKVNKNDKYFFYGSYYYAQSMNQRGGDFSKHAKKTLENIMISLQAEDGSWKAQEAHQVYSTSMAILSLSIFYNYLPIYQH